MIDIVFFVLLLFGGEWVIAGFLFSYTDFFWVGGIHIVVALLIGLFSLLKKSPAPHDHKQSSSFHKKNTTASRVSSSSKSYIYDPVLLSKPAQQSKKKLPFWKHYGVVVYAYVFLFLTMFWIEYIVFWRIRLFFLITFLLILTSVKKPTKEQKYFLYFARRPLLFKDYMVYFSLLFFLMLYTIFSHTFWYMQVGIATVGSALFLYIVLFFAPNKRERRYRSTLISKMYLVVFLVSLVGFVFGFFVYLDKLVVRGFEQKIHLLGEYSSLQFKDVARSIGFATPASENTDLGTDTASDDYSDSQEEMTTGQLSSITGSILSTGDVAMTGQYSTGSREDKKNTLTGVSMTGDDHADGSGEDDVDLGPASYTEVLQSFFSPDELLSDTRVRFDHVNKDDEIYPYFRTAQAKRLIGTTISPDSSVPCKNYIVMKGMISGWDVAITDPSNPFGPYREKAEVLDELDGCVRGEFIKKQNL